MFRNIILLCLVLLNLSGCAEFDRQFEIALYGSEEEAQKARAERKVKSIGENDKRQVKQTRKLFEQINEARKKNGAAPKNFWNEDLHQLAQMRARELAQRYDQYRPNGGLYTSAYDEFENLKNFKYSRTRELRFRGGDSAESALRYLLTNSETRKEILRPDMMFFAVGMYIEDGACYWIVWTLKTT